ncbi:MAG: sigma 54-interacting transcriptional regulator [Dyadobacter fermentans]
MKQKILIVEDFFVEANHLRILLTRAGYEVTGIARTFESAEEAIRQDHPEIVLVDIFLAGQKTGVDLARLLNRQNIPFIYLSANSNEEVLKTVRETGPSGFIVKPFREKDLLAAIDIARYLHESSEEALWRKEAAFTGELDRLAGDRRPWPERMLCLVRALQQLISFDYVAVGFIGPVYMPFNALHFLRTGFDEYQVMDSEGFQTVGRINPARMVASMAAIKLRTSPVFFNAVQFQIACQESGIRSLVGKTFDMHSNLLFPLPKISLDGRYFFLSLYSGRNDAFNERHLELCRKVQPALQHAVEEMTRNVMPGFPQVRLDEGIELISNKVPIPGPLGGMIGESHLFLHVLDLAVAFAATDSSVLIRGERGTGKEQVAGGIHALSARSDGPFIKVDCAGFSAGSMEGELFGFESAGSGNARTGRFGQAEGGTLFLDEIGEMPFEIQLKLLNVLQRHEMERVGGRQPVRVDVRVIVATSRDLEKEIAEGRFRLDLYYRLNAFCIRLPALRERIDDIELIATHFLEYFAGKSGRGHALRFSEKSIRMLREYDWPGNVAELMDAIETCVLFARTEIVDDIKLPSRKP